MDERSQRTAWTAAVVAVLVSCLAVAVPPAGGATVIPVKGKLKVKVGIADQKPSGFADARLRGLGLRYARLSVAWDTLKTPGETARLDAWVAGARSMGAEPLITFARPTGPSGRKPPTAAAFKTQFLGFRARYPDIRTYSSWNEANQCGTGTCRKPKLVVKYFDAIRKNCPGCKVLAADLLDQDNAVSWARAFRKAAKVEPKYWGLHGYIDANRGQTARTRRVLRAVPGEVWLTEIGGLVARRNGSKIKLPQGKVHAAHATKFIFHKLARVSTRITRIYLYHWDSLTPRDSWDSAFIGSDNVPRPAFAELKRQLAKLKR